MRFHNLAPLTVAVLLSAALCVAQATSPYSLAELKYLNALQQISLEEVWTQSLVWADSLLGDDHCREEFKKLTGKSLDDIDTWGIARLAYPSPWPFAEEAVAITTCTPPQTSIDLTVIHTFGSLYGAATLIHELAHIAVCQDYLARELSHEENEMMAMEVEKACAWKGYVMRQRRPAH
jgi:hypothetical protein